MTIPVPVPVSQFPEAGPLDGTELVPIIQNGTTVRTTISAIKNTVPGLGDEISYVATAGENNNIDISILTTSRVLVDTSAGDATITGIDSVDAADGQLLLFTNAGPNALTIASQSAFSLSDNRLYGVTNITLPSGGSMLCARSGTLLKWVMIV